MVEVFKEYAFPVGMGIAAIAYSLILIMLGD